jgi:predicted esterase
MVSMMGFSWENCLIARREIADAYEQVVSEYSIDTSQVVIGGFSSGGMASLDIVLDNTIPVAGFVVLCPPSLDTLLTSDKIRNARDRGVRGTLLTTEMDRRVPEQTEMVDLFRAEGLPCQFEVTPDVGHWIPDDIGARIDEALADIRKE